MSSSNMEFSIQDSLDPEPRSAYLHYQRHAIDHLVNKGHIAIGPTSVIRLDERGLLCADGEADVPEDVLLKEPRLFQAGVDVSIQSAALRPLLDSPLKDEPLKRGAPLTVAAYYSEAIAVLQSLKKTTHPVWAALEKKLEKAAPSQRSKSTLFEDLASECVKEDLDWGAFDFIRKASQHRPKMMDFKDSAALLYKLMGVQTGFLWLNPHQRLYSRAVIRDEELADSIFQFLSLLKLIQNPYEDESHLYPMLGSKFQKIENLLLEKRGAPKIRRLMELWDKTAGSESGDDIDDSDEDGEQPNKKQRCSEH
ncbi:hypothetical protein V8C42DRAFT_356941 [Trichoderma barbatum]